MGNCLIHSTYFIKCPKCKVEQNVTDYDNQSTIVCKKCHHNYWYSYASTNVYKKELICCCCIRPVE